MTLEELKASTRGGVAPTAAGKPLQALWHDANGEWEKAHACVQSEASREAAWVHAYLHRKEGDVSNAAYWYSRAGREAPGVSIDEEWESIAQALLDTSEK